jgi:hypothetical protein
MWPPDSILTEILSPIFDKGSPFQCLPEQVKQADSTSSKSLQDGFKRVLRCENAKQAQCVVFIWVLDQPYSHRNGLLSKVVYVEKTEHTIFRRWPPKDIEKLVKGADAEELPALTDLRRLARQCGSENGLFYRTIIARYGPMSVWWATVENLNKYSNHTLACPRDWERLLLTSYRKRYSCLPLKNFRCG